MILHQLALLHKTEKGYAHPGIPYLVERCDIGRSTVIQHLNELERAKPPAIVRKRNQGGRRCTTHYHLPWVETYIAYTQMRRKPPPKTIIRWESTAKRRARLEKEQSEDSDLFEGTNSPNKHKERSDHSAKTVRISGRKNNYKFIESPNRVSESRTAGPTAVGTILANLRFRNRNRQA